jgi:hypothetical protein
LQREPLPPWSLAAWPANSTLGTPLSATKVHSPGTLLCQDARHYYLYGPPVLRRFLPFWPASQVDRLKIMLVPLVLLLMPLVRWRIRRKTYPWCGVLRAIDATLAAGASGEELRGAPVALALPPCTTAPTIALRKGARAIASQPWPSPRLVESGLRV